MVQRFAYPVIIKTKVTIYQQPEMAVFCFQIYNKYMKSFKEVIKEGGVAVMRTDTLYGLVADAHNEKSVTRIYDIKKRNPLKPVIVLIAHYDQLQEFGVSRTDSLKQKLDTYWPGKVSIILEPKDTEIDTHYIHKGTKGIAFRIPNDTNMRKVLSDVGPLVAPSANPEGMPPAKTIQEAIDYFGDSVDYYIDGGEVIDMSPSKIIKISHGITEEIIRP